MKWKMTLALAVMVALGLMATPASAQPTGLCSSTCDWWSPCDKDCYDTGGGPFFSTCGAYGVCEAFDPPCEDPRSVTTRVDTVLLSSTVTATWCHYDHWYCGDPYAPARYYNYTTFSYRHDTVEVTELCDGTVTEEVISSSYSSAGCAQRTWISCYNPVGPPPLTCG